MNILDALLRWIHILAGIIWIGMLYFFNFVNGPFAPTMDADTKKKVVPELMPRALYWFRWGAAWTWFTGVLLLMLVFYHGGIMFEPGWGWGKRAIVLVALTFLAPFVYDLLQKSGLGKDPKIFGTVGFVLAAVFLFLTACLAGFSYRAFNIHLATMFGTIMAFNVWFRIWPAQQKIITAVKEGTAPDGALVSMAGTRSRHNVYMSVPLFWGMISQHTVTVGTQLGIPGGYGFVLYLLVILVAWHAVWHLYRKAPKVKGF